MDPNAADTKKPKAKRYSENTGRKRRKYKNPATVTADLESKSTLPKLPIPKQSEELLISRNRLLDNRNFDAQLVRESPYYSAKEDKDNTSRFRQTSNTWPVTGGAQNGRDYQLNESLKKAAAWYKQPREPAYIPIVPSSSKSTTEAEVDLNKFFLSSTDKPKPSWSSVANPSKAYVCSKKVNSTKYVDQFPELSPSVNKDDEQRELKAQSQKQHEAAVRSVLAGFTISDGHPRISQTTRGYSWMDDEERERLQKLYFDPAKVFDGTVNTGYR